VRMGIIAVTAGDPYAPHSHRVELVRVHIGARSGFGGVGDVPSVVSESVEEDVRACTEGVRLAVSHLGGCSGCIGNDAGVGLREGAVANGNIARVVVDKQIKGAYGNRIALAPIG